MGMRLLRTLVHNDVEVKIHRCSETAEYRCRIYRGGKAYEPGDYHTDDGADALSTARLMLDEEARR